MSGAEHSLLDLLRGLPSSVATRVACPAGTPLADATRRAGIPVDAIPGTDGSLKLQARDTLVAAGRMTLAGVLTARHARRMGADVMHANSIRAGLLTAPAARSIGVPSIVHIRDRLPRSQTADACLRFLATGADLLVANSCYTAEGVRAVTHRGRLAVVYNPVDLGRFDHSRVSRDRSRLELGLPPGAFVLAVIGQITPWKGQREAVQALSRLPRDDLDAHLLIVGEPKFVSSATRFDNAAYYAELRQLVADEGLGSRVHLLGERSDIPEIMCSLDLLLLPSWEEPFGRVVVEAMALGVPVLATSIGGPAEIVRDGLDGVLIRPREPRLWSEAIARLAACPELRQRLASAGRARAQDFALGSHTAAIQELYDDVTKARVA